MLWSILTHLDRQRIEAKVIFLEPGPFEREVAGLGLATDIVEAGQLRRLGSTARTVRRLAAMFRRDRPDLIVNWSAKMQLYGGGAAVLARTTDRVVWWQHGIPSGHWMDRLATLLPARAIGSSSRAGADAQKQLRPRRETFVVNPGIGLLEGATAGSPSKPDLGIPSGRVVAGIVGRLQPWKGQHRFLAAMAKLRARGHDVHGLVVGGDAYELSPEYAAEVRELVARLGLSKHVTLTGQVPDPGPYLGLMDIAVNASDPEPFGIVLIEAMAARVPVVAVGRGGPLDIVEDGVSGVLARSPNPTALADAIEALVVDPAKRARIADAGHARYQERFTAQQMTEGFTEALARLAGGH